MQVIKRVLVDLGVMACLCFFAWYFFQSLLGRA